MGQIGRRQFLVGSGAAFGMPLAGAQPQSKVWRIGFLSWSGDPIGNPAYEPLWAALRELRYVNGRNLALEVRSAKGSQERLAEYAAELAQLNVDVIVTNATPPTLAAQKATKTIPIVALSLGDPLSSGVVKSLARPGGNTTGVANLTVEVASKHVELALLLLPKATRIALLLNPTNQTNPPTLRVAQAAAQKARINVVPFEARDDSEIETAFAQMASRSTEVVIVATDAFLNSRGPKIAELAISYRLPLIAALRLYAEAGALVSYGHLLAENFRIAASYIDRIFKGAYPGDLPIQQPTLLELVINLKTARAIGLAVPQSLLARADEMIQ